MNFKMFHIELVSDDVEKEVVKIIGYFLKYTFKNTCGQAVGTDGN